MAEKLSQEMIDKLIAKAFDMLKFAYTPYSHWKVGAGLLATDGTIWGGCNIENAAYGPSNCAERTAFFKAVSEGTKNFVAIAVVGGHEGDVQDYCAPCGVCRQVMEEFCKPAEFQIIMAKSLTEYKIKTLEQMLPDGFGPQTLN